jgi:hypothetical protein
MHSWFPQIFVKQQNICESGDRAVWHGFVWRGHFDVGPFGVGPLWREVRLAWALWRGHFGVG